MPKIKMIPTLVIHGGTGASRESRKLSRFRTHLRKICKDAYRYLQNHSAVEAVIYAVRKLEDDNLFNAGTGSYLQQDGKVRMSASVMDGSRKRFSAVINIERVRNPVLVAQSLLDEDDRILAGHWATRWARRKLKMPVWNPITDAQIGRWKKWKQTQYGTVGAVARDASGNLAAATSTGGKSCDQPGRVSDSALPLGNYASENAAVSCTGVGEDIIEEALAVKVVQRVQDGRSLREAIAMARRELKISKRRAGMIGVDRRGKMYWATTAPIILAVGQTSSHCLQSF